MRGPSAESHHRLDAPSRTMRLGQLLRPTPNTLDPNPQAVNPKPSNNQLDGGTVPPARSVLHFCPPLLHMFPLPLICTCPRHRCSARLDLNMHTLLAIRNTLFEHVPPEQFGVLLVLMRP